MAMILFKERFKKEKEEKKKQKKTLPSDLALWTMKSVRYEINRPMVRKIL